MERLFVALDFDASVVEELSNLSVGLRNIRWTEENQYHLTLKFIGDCDKNRVEDVKHVLRSLTFDPFTITLTGLGCFPTKGDPRNLWIGTNHSDDLVNLHKKIDNQLFYHGIEKSKRKYHPHVTLGRFNSAVNTDDVVDFVKENNLFKIDNLMVDSYSLYTSDLTNSGAIHTLLESYEV